jgi:hypothetical protein
MQRCTYGHDPVVANLLQSLVWKRWARIGALDGEDDSSATVGPVAAAVVVVVGAAAFFFVAAEA